MCSSGKTWLSTKRIFSHKYSSGLSGNLGLYRCKNIKHGHHFSVLVCTYIVHLCNVQLHFSKHILKQSAHLNRKILRFSLTTDSPARKLLSESLDGYIIFSPHSWNSPLRLLTYLLEICFLMNFFLSLP